MTPRKSYLIDTEDDGLPAMTVHSWAEDKFIRSTMYAEMFSTGMKNRWSQRVYVGICSGPGHVTVKESKRRVLSSPLLALTHIRDSFTRYIFCDIDTSHLDALKRRVERVAPSADVYYVPGDANEKVGDVIDKIPDDALTLSVIDPYQMNVGFKTVRPLAECGNVDFIWSLMLFADANRAMELYSAENEKLDRFFEGPDWRTRWEEARRRNQHPVTFLAGEVGARMAEYGYIDLGVEKMYLVRGSRNIPLYYIAFFTRNKQGVDFWSKVLKYSTDQRDLFG